MKRLGIDIGSTTFKCAVLSEEGELLFSDYRRHASKIDETAEQVFAEIQKQFPDEKMTAAISGSAGMGIADKLGLPFVQEVYAEKLAVERLIPGTDVVVELGGEDAKILFLTGGFEMRMNGTCAGGTGAFIDQMASLLNITVDELNRLASMHERICPIASRCGVFAKSDIQPLVNQGEPKQNIAAGILQAVANQTVSGLAQGRQIKGNVVYLGGPLSFVSELRTAFDRTLKIEGVCPENSLYFVAMGSALAGVSREVDIAELSENFLHTRDKIEYKSCQPLFKSPEEYERFKKEHDAASDGIALLTEPKEKMYLGVDAGSTTTKMLLCDEQGNIFEPFYAPNQGDPVTLVRNYLYKIYSMYPKVEIAGAAVTGYGEELIKNAFHADLGLVETVAHFTAAKKFCPEVDFILDIGGQDIKCFQIRNGAIENLYLNEACSSGCGSFLQTFAATLGYSSEEFSRLGLFAPAPVDLGSRCTVFMNSSVKQAQKDGAGVENIAAGLSISVVKNALYKVIRCASPESLGKNIVVQGGTFLNDCVLRAFEQEMGREVLRPRYAPLMGAYGAALFALENCKQGSTLIKADELRVFSHSVRAMKCSGCGNHCSLTINSFNGGRKYIAGNRCSKPLGTANQKAQYNLYEYKLELLKKYCLNEREEGRKTIGIPMGLNMYELLPFWYSFYKTLGFNVIVSPLSNRKLYLKGQHTIPSDTVCYPAKLLHGHIESLLEQKPDAIFYPDMSYNVDEHLGVNHFNCPVVAYYPQLLKDNVMALDELTYICDFLSIARPRQFEGRIKTILAKYFPEISAHDIHRAAQNAYREYDSHLAEVRRKAEEYINIAKRDKLPVIVLAGRPYHVDPEVNHGIDRRLCDLGAVVLTEDSVSNRVEAFDTKVRNQWTYHARLYAAAKFVAESGNDLSINLVQLISFGCGVDAITSDETRSILESAGKIYTGIKIDEMSNMGAVLIRLRSLFSVIKPMQ